MGVEISTREELKELMKDLLSEIIDDAVEEEGDALNHDPDNDITIDDLFKNIADVVELTMLELGEQDHVLSVESAYGTIELVLSFCASEGWIGDYDEWEPVLEHFRGREVEFAGASGMVIPDIDIPPHVLTRVADIILRKWVLNIEGYKEDGEFSDADKIELVRSTLITLRNAGYLKYDPWLKQLLALLREDWKLFGGGFSGDMGTGSNPWSAAGW